MKRHRYTFLVTIMAVSLGFALISRVSTSANLTSGSSEAGISLDAPR